MVKYKYLRVQSQKLKKRRAAGDKETAGLIQSTNQAPKKAIIFNYLVIN